MTNDDTSPQLEPVSSVMKVFAILTALSESKSIGVTELSQQIMTSKSTVYRFLQTMKMLGYVSQEGESDKYSLTLKLFELSSKTLEHVDLIACAEPYMRHIGEQTKEALHLGVRDGESIVYVFKVDSKYNLRMQSRIGGRNPLYSTAIGKVLLANLSEQTIREILTTTEFVPSTSHTHRTIDSLLAELEQVKQQGYGEDNEEQEEGLRCIAAPVHDRFGNVIAGMSISYPVLRHTDANEQKYIEMLKTSCREISEYMGFYS